MCGRFGVPFTAGISWRCSLISRSDQPRRGGEDALLKLGSVWGCTPGPRSAPVWRPKILQTMELLTRHYPPTKRHPAGRPKYFACWKEDGRLHRVLLDAEDEKEARDMLGEMREKQRRGELGRPVDKRVLFSTVADTLIKQKRRAMVSEGWLQCLQNYRRNLLLHFGSRVRLCDLTQERLADYRDRRLVDAEFFRFETLTRKSARPVSANTVRKELIFVGACGALAMEEGFIRKLPWGKKGLPVVVERTTERKTKKYLTKEEGRSILDILCDGTTVEVNVNNGRAKDRPKARKQIRSIAAKPKLYRMILFLLSTGARPGREMFELCWGAVDMEEQTVTLTGYKLSRSGKGEKEPVDRIIPMTPMILAMFSDMKRGRPDERVFPSYRNLRRNFRQTLRWAGLPPMTPYVCRHSFISWQVQDGIPLLDVSRLAGSSVETIEKHYAHLAPANMRRAVAAVDLSTPDTSDIVAIRPQASSE